MWWQGVGQAQIDAIWPEVLPLFAELIECEPLRAEQIHAGLQTGEFQLWVFGEDTTFLIALITELRGDSVLIHLFAGKSAEKVFARKVFDILADWGKRKGAIKVVARPRPGLGRLMERYYGFERGKFAPHGVGRYFYKLDLNKYKSG